ncbi:MAG: hypothetical protein RR719_09465 [Akkermansia sp.]
MEQKAKNLINNKMKKIAIIIAIILSLQSVYSQNKKMINEIEKTINNNIYFYVGNIGMINNDLFIKRNDANNMIYSKTRSIVFRNDTHSLQNTQVIKIKQKGKEVFFEQVNFIDSEPHDLFIVFSKDAIYILDFSAKKFGKYIR